jgi:hypothetical protein
MSRFLKARWASKEQEELQGLKPNIASRVFVAVETATTNKERGDPLGCAVHHAVRGCARDMQDKKRRPARIWQLMRKR